MLAMRYPGVICPYLPEKDIRNKLLDKDNQKVQERKQGLHRFLNELLLNDFFN
jgi:hypothetical protein